MSADTNKPKRSRGKRIAALCLGFLLTPLLFELALQTASLFVGSDRVLQEGDCLVLCQGDSHTYGLWLPPASAYPAQLEQLLVENQESLPTVVNRGIPGKTSWGILAELEADLERWNPRAVCLWIGVNDRIGSRPDNVEQPEWWRSLRTLRLAQNLADRIAPQRAEESEQKEQEELPTAPVGDERKTFDVSRNSVTRTGEKERRLDFEGRDGEMQHVLLHGGNPAVEEYTTWIKEDLSRAAELVRASGALPILLTYPVDDHPRLEMNQAIVAVTERTGAKLVDLRPHFEAASELHGWTPLLYGRGHPKEMGYSVIARAVLAALVEEEIVDAPMPDLLERVREWAPAEIIAEPWLEDGEVVGVSVQYTPGHRVQALFSHALDEEGIEVSEAGSVRVASDVELRLEKAERRVSLADGELFRSSLIRTRKYLVHLDAEGRAQIRFHPELAAAKTLFSVVCAVTPREGVSRVSAPIELR